ncbi:MAG: hypothetical protein LW806_08285 [Planctomycetaceae bacterium]|nr:hypothetical protein [Planctomycetaceae bacterium]
MRCIACDFDLLQTTDGRCPECGREFDRNDIGTFIGEGHGRVARRSAAAPGWPMFTLAALLGYLVLCTDFSPAGTFEPVLRALLAGILVGCLYLVRLFVAFAARVALPKRRPRVVPVALWRWLTPIAIVLVASVLVELRVPRMIAFWLDRSSLAPIAVGPGAEPSAFAPVDAWTGRVTKGAVWDDIEVTGVHPAEGYGASFPPGWGWVVEAGYMRGVRGADQPALVRVVSVSLPRLAIFPIEGTGYGNFSCAAWAYAPGATDVFFVLPEDGADLGPVFLRYSGDWFVSAWWIQPLEDRPVWATTPAAEGSPVR